MSLQDFEFVPLQSNFPIDLGLLFEGESNSYKQYFHPFDLNQNGLSDALSEAVLDKYFVLTNGKDIAAMYMLRGFDDGFLIPSFGMYVFEKYSGKGIGSAVLESAISYCVINNYQAIYLSVYEINKAAYHLYLKHGFIVAGEGIVDRYGQTIKMMLDLNEKQP